MNQYDQARLTMHLRFGFYFHVCRSFGVLLLVRNVECDKAVYAREVKLAMVRLYMDLQKQTCCGPKRFLVTDYLMLMCFPLPSVANST